MKSYFGKIVLKDNVILGYVSVDNGLISYVGERRPSGEIIDLRNNYIAPGLIDIHCHSSINNSATVNPKEVSEYHFSHGVTTMLLSFYKDVAHEKLISCLKEVKELMATQSNVHGAHLEGPYINADLGYDDGRKNQKKPIAKEYEEYIKFGVVKQWTFAPELDGVLPVIKIVKDLGIIPSIGHSEATYSQVKEAYENGARIVTHIFDATGTPKNTSFDGTQEMNFSESCMLMDDMFYEVICDSEWVHVRKEKLDLLIKTVGVDRVVAITDMDCAGAENDGRDIAVVDGQLFGTKLTLDKVTKNLYSAGYSVPDVFKMVSNNPAKALGANDRGEIAVGKRADLIVLDEKLQFMYILN